MQDDDRPIGRLLSRREIMALLGMSGAGLLLGCRPAPRASRGLAESPEPAAGLPPCVVRPEQTEGPYFVDERLNRSDIRSDPASGVVSEGAPLDLRFRVSRIDGGRCRPLEGATVDVWHCDARGVYSDVQDPGFDTQGREFLRGYQLTGAAGAVRFRTIYPGWYEGRTVHVHFKIRTPASGSAAHAFTSQLYFDDALTDRVHALEPYASRGRRDVRNEDDGIYRRGGRELMLAISEGGPGREATFDIGLHMG